MTRKRKRRENGKKRERNRRRGRENRRSENLAYYVGCQIQQIIAKGKKAKRIKSKGYKTKLDTVLKKKK